MYGIGFETTSEAPRYKVGDYVRVVNDGRENNGSFHGADVGEVLNIKSISDDGRVFFAGDWFVYPHEIAPAFTRGKSIRLTRNQGLYKQGHQGTVTIENDENVGVLMDIGRYASFPHDALEVFKRGANDNAAATKPKFEAGDKVTTSGASGDPGVGVVLSRNDDATYQEHYLALVASNCDTKQANDNAPHIVVVVDHGRPSPEYLPEVYTGEASAMAEAERLARATPGAQFDVWRRIAGRVAEQHVELKEVA